ncbi:MAG TPA: DUF4105 domain-containing protein [Nitrospiria bacterium]|jgi:hypothetical protein
MLNLYHFKIWFSFGIITLSFILYFNFPVFGQDTTDEYLNELIEKARGGELWNHRYWHLLLHYKKDWWGGYKSQADGLNFFLSVTGRKNPQAELEATITAFFEPLPKNPEDQHPQCRFPARYTWLKEQLNFDPENLQEQPCPRLETWRSRLDPQSITIIFADAYLDNPASMYGHTFLRLNHKSHGPEERLLDYTINFSADTTTRNGVMFTIKGLFGGYPGRFSTTPYYIKVQSYTNLESRDLWEYHLNLTSDQINRLVLHLWEMGTTYFNYFFLDENCSYQLLPLIEIANPKLYLTDSLHPWVIPVDTIRVLIQQPGLVTSVEYRPSHMNQMLNKRSLLSPNEIEVTQALSERMDEEAQQELARFPDLRKALILDTAYDYYRYREGFTRNQGKESKKRERKILLARNQLGPQPSYIKKISKTESPLSGHQTGRTGFGFGLTRNSTFEEVSFRPALHDLAGNQTGFIPNSQLEMFHLVLRFDNKDRTPFVEKLNLLEIISLSPWDRWIKKFSWKVTTGLDLAKELDCIPRKCLYYGLNVGKGLSLKTEFFRQEILFLMAEADMGVGRVFRDYYRLGGGGRVGLLLDITSFWRIQIEGALTHFPLGDIHTNLDITATQAFSFSNDLEFRFTIQKETAYKEALFSFNKYF